MSLINNKGKFQLPQENVWVVGCLGFLLLGVAVFAITWLSFGILLSVDWLTGARLTPNAPAIMWAIWGAILGGTMAFWLSAPLYGLRKQRTLIIAAPLTLMVLLGWLTSLSS